MPATKFVCHATVIAASMLIIAGCGQSAPSNQQAATDAERSTAASPDGPVLFDDEVEPASAESRVVIDEFTVDDEAVQPAVATTPVETTEMSPTDPESPATLPEGPDAPLPLEEPINSGETMPEVFFTEQHAAWSKVHVGDQFPKLELADLDGEPQPFGDLLGEKLTIVFFWQSALSTSTEALADLQSRFLKEFGDQGVAVVGVNVGDEPRLAQELAKQASATFAHLSDQQRKAFDQVATQKLPRVYLLDPAGTVLWFDIEYSRTTRQQLLSAIRFALKSE